MITLNNKNLCENCFSEVTGETCPHCGFRKSEYRRDPVALVVGSVLNQRYMIGGVVGKGGFGITYLAYDLKLDARVAVKEYYPMGLAIRNPGSMYVTVSNEESGESFRTGAEKFYNEAKMVAKFNGNPNIVSVHDFFYENDTVYFIMGYLQGQTLKSYLKKKKITEGQAVQIFNQISNALLASHSMNILHRDVSPDNLMLCDDGTIRLLDFGAARQVMAEQSQSLSVILKQGYAPLEQYQRKGKQGPWTDIYALGATIYTALTGDMLNDPMSRLEDDSDYEQNKFGITESLWKIIQKCTRLKVSERYQDIAELKGDLQSVGIEPEKFKDVEEEITDFLRGKVPKSNTPEAGNIAGSAPSPTSDPNATVFLGPESTSGKSEDGRSNETVALSPEDASSYGGGTGASGQGVPAMNNAQVINQPYPGQYVRQPQTGGMLYGSPQAGMQQMPVSGGQPVPQPSMQQMSQPVVQQNMGGTGASAPDMTGQSRQGRDQGIQTAPVKKKKGLHPVVIILIILVILAGTFLSLKLYFDAQDSKRIQAEWDEFEEAFGITYGNLDTIYESDAEEKDIPVGVLVNEVIPGGAADKTGIKPDDVITEFDGNTVDRVYNLEQMVLSHNIGDTVDIMIERKIDGTWQKMNGTITLGGGSSSAAAEDESDGEGESDNDDSENAQNDTSDEAETAFLGVNGETVEEGSGMPAGVYISKVYDDSGADKAGIQEGYIIVSMDGKSVESWEECADIVQSHKPGDSLLVVMKRKPDGSDNYSNSFRTYVILGSED